MNLVLRAHHTSVHDDLRDHAEKKLARLDRYLPKLGDALVEVTREETRAAAHRFRVQVTVRSGDAILRAEERSADPQTALDLAVGVISQQAQRHGKRLRDRYRRGEAPPVGAEETSARPPARAARGDGDDSVDEYIAGKVVRVKHIEAKPMSQEEALAQMDLLGHDFFLFLDSSSNEYALLYKRKDGGYGLIAPHR
jgi:putative sigma-54 modulation protein